MRRALINGLLALAERDERVVLLTGDLGFSVVEPFQERFPGRFFNLGVAEQNMIGVATGLAHAGFLPFAYSIAPFAALRPYEFIRNGPVLHSLPVRIIGVGGGFDYGAAGASHHCLEDLALMRALPGLAVISPCDSAQLTTALEQTHTLPGPVYLRLGKNEAPSLPELGGRFVLGRPELVKSGERALIVATGAIASEAVSAAELLEREGVTTGVLLLATLQPCDRALVAQHLRTVPRVFSLEAHQINGGLGSLLSEVIAEEGLPCRLTRLGARTLGESGTGSSAFLNEKHGLTAARVAAQIRSTVA